MAASPSPPHSPSAPPLSPSAISPSSPSPHTSPSDPPPPPTSPSPSPFPPPPPSTSFNYIPHKKYDVYLSFRRADTRQNFVSHLYTALIRKQINTFVDHQLIRGDEISPSLLNGIEESKISVVILSRGYASSAWCLDELEKILECKHRFGQIVIHVFYQVHQSDLRNQTGIVGKQFRRLEKRGLDRQERWRDALKEVSKLSGFYSCSLRSESLLIEEIIEDILKKLNDPFLSGVHKDLGGIESCIKEIESLLSYGSINVKILGILGMGGIGKTTIASVIFSRISGQFESSFLAPNIREELEKIGGLTHLRRKLLSTLLENKNLATSISIFSLNFESES